VLGGVGGSAFPLLLPSPSDQYHRFSDPVIQSSERTLIEPRPPWVAVVEELVPWEPAQP